MQQEDPSSLHREIKGLIQDYRKSLQGSTPWDRELEFQRNNIRRRIVHLIFTFPHSPQAQNVETPLWLDTSYALISLYRQRMSVLDKASSPNPSGPARPHAVELRKLLNKFRSFLSAEESFWNGFVLRVVRTYGLEEAKPALLALNITSPDPVNRQADISQGVVHPSFPHPTPSSEDRPSEPITQEHRAKKLELVHKVLICLGDLARYREQYNESNGRPKAGKKSHTDDWVPKKDSKGGRRGGPSTTPPKARDYARAAECYHQARLLIPDNGNPSNQLAVLAVWNSDSFNSVYHCYRALCVKKPFQTARDNLEKPLKKALETPRHGTAIQQPPVEAFKESVIFLHALWHYKPGSSSIQKQGKMVISSWSNLISNRTLPSEVIVKCLILSLGALWHVRAFSPTVPLKNPGQTTETPTKVRTSKDSEPSILGHILDMLRSLMEIGLAEMEEARNTASSSFPVIKQGDHHLALAQNITAAFRRTLPALRIGFKWIKSNLEYIARACEGPSPNQLNAEPFWEVFSNFIQSLGEVFPLDNLPLLSIALEEDSDLRGFLPLKRSMENLGPHLSRTHGIEQGSQPGVHPNEEQLMRIADLLVDAKYIKQSQTTSISPVVLNGPKLAPLPSAHLTSNIIYLTQGRQENPVEDDESDLASHRPTAGDLDEDREFSVPNTPADGHDFRDGDDDSFTVSSKTEDDPVNMAMRATLESENGDDDDEDEEDEDMVVYQPKVSNARRALARGTLIDSANGPRTQTPTFSHPVAAIGTPSKSLVQPNDIPTTPPAGPVTAQDLLARAMLGGFSPPSAASTNQTTAAQKSPTMANTFIRGSPSRPGGQRSSSATRQPTSVVQQPMLFGGSGSVWTPGPTVPPVNPNPASTLPIPVPHPYALPQHHLAHGFQSWPTRPQDMATSLTGFNNQASRLSSGSDPSSPVPLPFQPLAAPFASHSPAHGAFNPTVGSIVRPSGHVDPGHLGQYGNSIQISQYSSQHQQHPLQGPFAATPIHRAWG